MKIRQEKANTESSKLGVNHLGQAGIESSSPNPQQIIAVSSPYQVWEIA